MKRALILPFTFCLFTFLSFAQTLAPGAPGKDSQWATAGKQGVGTSANLESKVWFTLAQGVMTEVYYPDVTVANVHLLQFVVVNKTTGKVETEQDDTTQEIGYLDRKALPFTEEPPSSLSFDQTNLAKDEKWRIWKRYITDPANNTVLIDVEFTHNIDSDDDDYDVYVYYDPSINNSGLHDTAWTQSGILLAADGNKVSALSSKFGFSKTTNGFLGTSDGLTQLKNRKQLHIYDKADDGNVVQFAKLNMTGGLLISGFRVHYYDTLALSFGKTANEATKAAKMSLQKGFENTFSDYEKGWSDYVKTLRKVEPKYQAQFNMAAMILKAHEDKTVRGANIASLTVPWGGGENANENNIGGYHLVWSRDLYQVATAFMALGDKDAAVRALDFLFNVQQKPDGSFPQNSFLDGKPFWGSLQMDEVAFPLILAYQLGRNDKATYENHVKKAADFIVRNGPITPQERWEERTGYSPSTIAAEIAGLVCAADIARKNGDEASATIYLAAADDWARNIERWTVTTTGNYGDGNYYQRIAQKGNPDAGDKIDLGNGAGIFDEREIVDAGFLELVRLGIKSPDDPLIAKSVKVIDQIIRVQTPNGDAFYRYNHDGYGEMDDGRRWNWDGKYTGKGRLWALLSGERGQYELAQFAYGNEPQASRLTNWEQMRMNASKRLDSMAGFANDGLMIPEQVWDKEKTPQNIDRQFVPKLEFGEGTGSATPLAWSMAQFIRLAVNLQAGKNLDTPDIVYERYVKNGIPGQTSNFGGMDEEFFLPVKAGEKFSFTRPAPKGTKIGYVYGGKTTFVEVGAEGKFTVEVIAPETMETVVVGIATPSGSTAFERVNVRSADRVEPQKFSAELVEKISAAEQSPLIEKGKAIFFYRGKAKNVMIAGDFSNWNPRIQLQSVGEDLFAFQMNLADATRAEYKLIVDGKWILDELNPNKLDNGVGGENSFFTMPDYQPGGWDAEIENSPLKPEISELEIESKKFGKRSVKIYLPSEYFKRGIAPKLPVLYLQDGSEYITRAKAINVLENLTAAKQVEPFMIVFIDPQDRTQEYWANDDWADFVADEVVPAVENKYFSAIKSGRENRALLGASLGGVTSFWIGLKHPEIFARIGGQSSSFWVDDERVVKALEKLDASKTKFTFYLDDGTLEGAADSRRVNVMLRGKGFPVTYVEGETGHNWTSWRDRLANAFVALWK